MTCGGIRLVERNANVVCDEMKLENKSQKSNGTQDTKYIVEKKQCKNTNIFWGRLPLQFPVGNISLLVILLLVFIRDTRLHPLNDNESLKTKQME